MRKSGWECTGLPNPKEEKKKKKKKRKSGSGTAHGVTSLSRKYADAEHVLKLNQEH
jgi:hypothetical protein